MQGRLETLAGKLATLYEKSRTIASCSRGCEVQIALHKPNEASRLIDAARITFLADADGLYMGPAFISSSIRKSRPRYVAGCLAVDRSTHRPAMTWVQLGRQQKKP